MSDPIQTLRTHYAKTVARVEAARQAKVVVEGMRSAVAKAAENISSESNLAMAEGRGLSVALSALGATVDDEAFREMVIAEMPGASAPYATLAAQASLFKMTPQELQNAASGAAPAPGSGMASGRSGVVETQGRVPPAEDAMDGVAKREATAARSADGTENHVSSAARAAMAKAREKAAKGEHQPPRDDTGRIIPASEQMVIDDMPPDASSASREGGDGEPGMLGGSASDDDEVVVSTGK